MGVVYVKKYLTILARSTILVVTGGLMPKKSRKSRLNPSKLLVMLLYGSYPYLEVEYLSNDSRCLTLEIGKFARLMRVKNAHISEYLQWLEEMGFLTITACSPRTISVVLTKPQLFMETEAC